MRSMESNLRGVRSESGIRMANSDSSAVTRSLKLKESRRPDSNRDSSGDGSMGLSARRRMMARILVRLSMGVGVGRYLRAGLPETLVLLLDIGIQCGGEAAVSGRGEVDIVVLAQAGHNPLAHGTFTAHALASVPVGAGVFAAGILLRRDDIVDAIQRAEDAAV